MIERVRALPLRDLTLLALALAVLVTFNVLRSNAEPNPTESLDSYSTFDAQSGGYRAWYELLQRENVKVDRFQERPAFLDSHVTTLIWAEPIEFDPRQASNTKDDIAALEAWVKAGGHFVYIGHDEAAAKAGILKLPATHAVSGKPASQTIAATLRAAGVRRVASGETTLRWKLPRNRATTTLVADALGPLALTYPYGNGTIVAFVDQTAFDNARIGDANNARLAFAIVASPATSGQVAFDEAAHGYLVPEHWWQIVPRRLLIGLLLAVSAFAIALIGAAIRLGPAIVPPRRDDASSAEFVDSLAALFERGHAARQSTDDIARSTIRVVTAAFGLYPQTAPQEIEARIERPELRADFRTLVHADLARRVDERMLLETAAAAQRLRKEYASDGRPRH